ncbi:Hypothetical protein HVR_LOCUS907 [uncultured virus]|nr:Hypothetical protein HVR_LOCUS907 [uncultured virus]
MDITEQVYNNGRIGLSCKVVGTLKESDVIEYFNKLREKNVFSIYPRFKKKNIDFMTFNTHQEVEDLKSVLDVINSDNTELISKAGRIRGICYNICKLYGYKYERIFEHGRKYIGCNEYLPKNRSHDLEQCGCDFAPRNFHKYHVTNSYDDDIAYSNIPFTYKLGVRIIRTIKSSE